MTAGHPDVSSLPSGTSCPYANVIPSSMLANYYYQWCVLATIGLFYTLCKIWKLIRFIHFHFLRGATDLTQYGATKGGWAVITGCTDGIGQGLAEVLSQRGFNLLLISRSKEKLDALDKNLRKANPNGINKVLAIDCNDASAENMNKINQAMQGEDIGMVVNNVGISTDIPCPLELHTDRQMETIIGLNCLFSTKMTHLSIPHLKRRKRSMIVNISSITAEFAPAFLSVYAATKAYNDVFSRALTTEVKKDGIDVVSVLPSYVMSSMSGIKRESFFVPSASRFSSSCVNKLIPGRVLPFWPHHMYLYISKWLPASFVANKIYKDLGRVREKMLAKQKKN